MHDIDMHDIQFVDLGHSKVSYRVDGSGPGLVLVHGTGANADTNWSHLIHHFTDDWTVVRPNYSGSGQTQDNGGQLSLAMLAEQVVAAAKAANAAPFDLVGYSLGASLAAYIAAEYPDDVRRVVLVAGFIEADTRMRFSLQLWRDLINHDRTTLAKIVLLTGFSPNALSQLSPEKLQETVEFILATNDWDGMARQVELDLTLNISNQVGRIAQPTLVLGCTSDHMVTPSLVKALAGSIPNAQYQEIAAGHLAPLEHPEEFCKIIKGFFMTASKDKV